MCSYDTRCSDIFKMLVLPLYQHFTTPSLTPVKLFKQPTGDLMSAVKKHDLVGSLFTGKIYVRDNMLACCHSYSEMNADKTDGSPQLLVWLLAII